MPDDPLSPRSTDPWVTSSSPAHDRPLEAGPEPVLDQRLVAPPPRSAHWGLAALLVGGPLMVGAPIQLQLNRSLWTLGPQGMKLPIAFAGTLGCFVLIMALGGTGILCGVRGWMLAPSERQPIALSLAGTILSGVALVIWLGIFVDLMAFFFEHMH